MLRFTKRHRSSVVLLCAIALGSATIHTYAANVGVMIMNFAYDPATLTINVNDTVTWQNHDDATHSVTFQNGMADSGGLAGGDMYSFTFTQPGTFAYVCSFHAGMQGSVTVIAPDVQPQGWLPLVTRP